MHPEAYSEPSHIYENLRMFRTLTYIKPDTCSEPYQRFKTEFFAKIVKSYNYFSKNAISYILKGFGIRPSLNKYSLTCRATACYVSYETY